MGKREEIVEFLRFMLLQTKELDFCLSILVYLEAPNSDVRKVVTIVKERIQGNQFIQRHIDPFDKIFLSEEIKLLINFYREITVIIDFYRSETVKKFLKNWKNLFYPIYQAYCETIKEVLEQEMSNYKPLANNF